MSSEKSLTPQIRFKGFTEAWEQRKLSELTTMHARIGWQNLRMSEFLDSGNYYLITGTDFENGYVNLSTCHYVNKDRYDQDPNIQIDNGSILITKDGTLGKVALVQGLDKPATLNAGVFNVVIRNEEIVDNGYLYQYLKAPFLLNYVAQTATGGTIKHLNQSILVDFPVSMPSKGEQELIGDAFLRLDNLITLHQRKLDALKKIKSALLEKMFPKNGSNVPEIRFTGFTEAWEQRKVFEIVNRLDNLRVPVASNLRIPGNTPYYGANGIQDYVSGFTHNGEFVLVAEDGANDLKNYPVHYVSGKIWVNNHAHVLQGLERVIDNRFLSFSLVHCDIEVLLVGGGRSKLNANTLMNELTLSLPNLNEQKNIRGLFFKLDDLITLHQRKLDTLKKIKSALLEKMFV